MARGVHPHSAGDGEEDEEESHQLWMNYETSENRPTASSSSSSSQVRRNSDRHPRNNQGSSPSLQETQDAAQLLFHTFCREKLQGVGDLQSGEFFFHGSSPFDGYANPVMVSVGRDLRRIAEAFERSNERESIRRRAFDVRIFNLTYDQFRSLLEELFRDGITRERIVVLFFFCTDVAVRAYNSGPVEYCLQLLNWSFIFIKDYICSWVQRQGGWEVVLGDFVPRVAVTAMALLACTALAIYIKQNVWPSP